MANRDDRALDAALQLLHETTPEAFHRAIGAVARAELFDELPASTGLDSDFPGAGRWMRVRGLSTPDFSGLARAQVAVRENAAVEERRRELAAQGVGEERRFALLEVER